jgi:hypothetical protein
MRLRHSHPFEVLELGVGAGHEQRYFRHRFSHTHECKEGDGHAHSLGDFGHRAVFPKMRLISATKNLPAKAESR